MKKLVLFVMLAVVLASFATGCGKKAERNLYNADLSKTVTLGKYKGIKVDKSSDDFKKYYDQTIESDVTNYNLYVKKTEGTVASGDTANIDYTGYKDGVAFEGGTASGYDLTIGSGSFIPGFEDGLIGKKIGDTVDLNLTFPEQYQSADLAGKAVVFTVKINYVTTTDPQDPADYFSQLSFKTLDEYKEDVTKRAINSFLLDNVTKNSKVSKHSDEDANVLLNAFIELYDQRYKEQYNVDFETVLSSQGQTLDSYKKQMLESTIPSLMDYQMTLYAILDNEKLDIDKESVSDLNISSEVLKEYTAVENTVVDFLYKSADIK